METPKHLVRKTAFVYVVHVVIYVRHGSYSFGGKTAERADGIFHGNDGLFRRQKNV